MSSDDEIRNPLKAGGKDEEKKTEKKKADGSAYTAKDFPAFPMEATPRKSRGCLKMFFGGCLIKTIVGLLLLVTAVVGIIRWHPWNTETVTTTTEEDPTICPPGQRGEQRVEHLRVLGIRVKSTGESKMCVE